MILYQLRCADDHTFEAWFRDSRTYDRQAESGHVECPYCGSTKITKAPMAPSIAKGAGKGDVSAADALDALDDARASEVAQKILDAVGRIRSYAEENFENVGEDFADEARKIHYGEAEERGIYGKASEDDARELEEEGVEFVRLPGTSRRDG